MAFRSVGINLPHLHLDGVSRLTGDLEALKSAGPDFVEVWPHHLGIILGGALDPTCLRPINEALLEADLAYTVHAPLEINLMDLTAYDLHRDVLNASLRFANGIGAEVVVCHAGQRVAERDARSSLKDQLAAERYALKEAGDLAAELGVTIAVENYYPELPILQGAIYDYSVWPSELAEQISAVDHPAVGICLDVGHAALAAGAFGFDYLEECAAVAPFVRHIHLHDNLGKTNLTGVPPVSEHPVYGLGDLHLPPGRGTIPLRDTFLRVDFPENPACCVELSPDLCSSAPAALRAARELGELPVRHEPHGTLPALIYREERTSTKAQGRRSNTQLGTPREEALCTLAERFDTFLFDLDGTVYLGNSPLPCAREALTQLRGMGKAVRFLTNDPRPTRAEVTQRLIGMGIEVHQQEIFTSGWATARYLGQSGVSTAYVVGSPGLVSEIREAGIEVIESGQPKAVVVGGDEHTSYTHIQKATKLVLGGAEFVATNPDASYPTPEGPIPGAGAVVAAVQVAAGEQPTVTIGKPHPKMFDMALEGLNIETERVVMVGDNPSTDILGAHRTGITGILITKTPPQFSSDHDLCVPDATIPNLSLLFDPEVDARRCEKPPSLRPDWVAAGVAAIV